MSNSDASNFDTEVTQAIYDFSVAMNKLKHHGDCTRIKHETFLDYVQLSRHMIEKRNRLGKTLSELVNSTNSKNTYFKRIAALKTYIFWIGATALENLLDADCHGNKFHEAEHNIKVAARDLTELVNIINEGSINKRSRKNSKRKSLKGLPKNWREIICNFNEKSKYREAMLISALTGCRPIELAMGIKISMREKTTNSFTTIDFEIRGAKVDEVKGQPNRIISYVNDEKNQLLQALIALINLKESGSHYSCVKSPSNFTHEIIRLARNIWPKHKEVITAYSFRHQFAADLKKYFSGDVVSEALGHCSEKTRRTYGSASQCRARMPKLTITADRKIKSVFSPNFTKVDDGVEP